MNRGGGQIMEGALPRLSTAYREHGNWDFLRQGIQRQDIRQWLEILLPSGEFKSALVSVSAADGLATVPRMGLLDTGLHLVTGNQQVNADSIRRPVVVDGRTVGWLAMVPFERTMASGEARFLEQQRTTSLVIIVASLIVVALLTFVLTRTLLGRMRSLAHATQALASGDYASRVKMSGSDELGTLAQDFNRMAQALEHTDRARRSFMADISHELRTPLAVVRAEIEAIQDGIRPPTANSLRDNA